MKTIEELKRLYKEIEELDERKERLVRQLVVELFNTDGYKILLRYESYRDCSVDYLLESTDIELYSDEVYFFDHEHDLVLSISFLSSLEEQIKREREYLERIREAREMKEREKELETLKRLKEKYENKKDNSRN